MQEIENDVPIPALKRGAPPKYNWHGCERVGDSFFVSDGCIDNIRAAARAFELRHGRTFRAREMTGGVRVWRVK